MGKPLMNRDNARVTKQAQQMEEIEREGICPFCRENFEDHHRAPIIWENNHWIVSENDYPYEGSKVHLLIVVKRHIEHVLDLSFEEIINLLLALRWISKHYTIPGATFLMRFGDMNFTGATIAHLHAHLVCGADQKDSDESLKVRIGYKIKTPSE